MHRGHGTYTSTAHTSNRTTPFKTKGKTHDSDSTATGRTARTTACYSVPLMRNDTITYSNVGCACAAARQCDAKWWAVPRPAVGAQDGYSPSSVLLPVGPRVSTTFHHAPPSTPSTVVVADGATRQWCETAMPTIPMCHGERGKLKGRKGKRATPLVAG